MSRFIAHVVMVPNDGGQPYTVETEFKATGYPSAWEHIQRLGLRFDAKISSHRLQALAGGDEADDVVIVDVAVADEKKPTLPVNVTPKPEPTVEFFGIAEAAMPEVVPFPMTEGNDDDTVAA